MERHPPQGDVPAESIRGVRRGPVRNPVPVKNSSMKIVICGNRGCGKTGLWNRFQGQRFNSSYQPTNDIKAATINWQFMQSNVKVEVWDIVDRSFTKTSPTLDASTIDIYKETAVLIYMVSPWDIQSLEYVRGKCKTVPLDIAILLLLNFKDKVWQATVASNKAPVIAVTMKDIQLMCDEIRQYRKSVGEAPTAAGLVHGFEISVYNCFGLDALYNYLEIPFLALRRRALLDQLARAEQELQFSESKLCNTIQTSDYEGFASAYER